MIRKSLNVYKRLQLKYTDKDAYKEYKYLLKVNSKPNICLDHLPKEITHIKHSGNCGDIIYSLPAAFFASAEGFSSFSPGSGSAGALS